MVARHIYFCTELTGNSTEDRTPFTVAFLIPRSFLFGLYGMHHFPMEPFSMDRAAVITPVSCSSGSVGVSETRIEDGIAQWQQSLLSSCNAVRLYVLMEIFGSPSQPVPHYTSNLKSAATFADLWELERRPRAKSSVASRTGSAARVTAA